MLDRFKGLIAASFVVMSVALCWFVAIGEMAASMSAVGSESCKSTCTGAPNRAHALIWMIVGLAALVGALALRQRKPESADWWERSSAPPPAHLTRCG